MKNRILTLALPCLLALAGAAWGGQNTEFIELFTRANAHYRHSEYKQAIDVYEKILEDGKASGALYYNLANAYYRSGEVGEAVLNYERALRIMPRDSDLKYNREFLRRRLPKYPEGSGGIAGRLLLEHIRFYSLEESGNIILLLLALCAAVSVGGLYRRWPRAALRNSLIVLGTLCIVYLIGAVFKVQYERNRAVALESAAARFEPKDDATTHFELMEGEEVRRLDSQSGWSKVMRPDGKMGWVPEKAVENI